MLYALKMLTVDTLLFERTNEPFNHVILLKAMWHDKFLAQPVASNQRRIVL